MIQALRARVGAFHNFIKGRVFVGGLFCECKKKTYVPIKYYGRGMICDKDARINRKKIIMVIICCLQKLVDIAFYYLLHKEGEKFQKKIYMLRCLKKPEETTRYGVFLFC